MGSRQPRIAPNTFLSLPRELRDHIYGLIVHREGAYYLHGTEATAHESPAYFSEMADPILNPRHSHPQIVQEAAKVLFRENTLAFNPSDLEPGYDVVMCVAGNPYYWILSIDWRFILVFARHIQVNLYLSDIGRRDLLRDLEFVMKLSELKTLTLRFRNRNSRESLQITGGMLEALQKLQRKLGCLKTEHLKIDFEFILFPLEDPGFCLVRLDQISDVWVLFDRDSTLRAIRRVSVDHGQPVLYSAGIDCLNIRDLGENEVTQNPRLYPYDVNIGAHINAIGPQAPVVTWPYIGNRSIRPDPKQYAHYLRMKDSGRFIT